jgi:hypothetical protein
MVPNRVRPGYDLLPYYLKTGDARKALYRAEQIMQKPVKISFDTTQNPSPGEKVPEQYRDVHMPP